ncbi:hypothetical protein [Fimbriiglobus ruber]|uniref:hypothetical protein n=1 Tax=Fimbriiglobus ruber TaxID=1908690 RepID=UPI000B4AAFB6|nr:hypothetical protein [Fimbriiglobus ruber]
MIGGLFAIKLVCFALIKQEGVIPSKQTRQEMIIRMAERSLEYTRMLIRAEEFQFRKERVRVNAYNQLKAHERDMIARRISNGYPVKPLYPPSEALIGGPFLAARSPVLWPEKFQNAVAVVKPPPAPLPGLPPPLNGLPQPDALKRRLDDTFYNGYQKALNRSLESRRKTSLIKKTDSEVVELLNKFELYWSENMKTNFLYARVMRLSQSARAALNKRILLCTVGDAFLSSQEAIFRKQMEEIRPTKK